MFGYVLPPIQDLPDGEGERFRRTYCGLCHTLGRRYGTAARFILNYDFTFLAILLSEPQEADILQSRCLSSPVKKQSFTVQTPALELAADESVILAWWQARDGVADHGPVRGLKYRAASTALHGAYRKAAALRPDFDAGARRQLETLARLEEENCPSMDRAADAFAGLLAMAAGEVEEPIRRRVLEQMLYHLGRWVYLIDAADDLQEDAESGRYNPVALRFSLKDGQWTPEARQVFSATLDHSVRQIAAAFELWDFGVWRPVLEKTIYYNLFRVGRAVLDGAFHRRRRAEKEEPK